MGKDKIKLVAILVGIILPVLSATVFFMLIQGDNLLATNNKGHLIQPVMDVTVLGMEEDGLPVYVPFDDYVAGVDPGEYVPRTWGVIYLGTQDCNESCRERLGFLRALQVRLSADASRVTRYYLYEGGALGEDTRSYFGQALPQMRVTTTALDLNDVLHENIDSLAPDVSPVNEHYIFVVDPVGNVMLYFTPENTPEEILSDLETLLDQTSLG